MKRSLPLVFVIALVAASRARAEQTRDGYMAAADPICLGRLEAQSRALHGFMSDVKHGQVKKAAGKLRRATSPARSEQEAVSWHRWISGRSRRGILPR